MATSGKVMIIGLDGATLDLLGPWMSQGLLPNLSTFLRDGIVTTLESVVPPQTASGWSSIVTGKNPGKHGIFGFTKRESNGYDLLPVNAADRKSRDLWEILSQFGKNVGVMNVPLTYPIRKVNGFIISGLLTPQDATDFCYPEGLIDEIVAHTSSFIPFSLFGGHEDDFLDRLYRTTDSDEKALYYLIENKQWDFFMVVFYGTDKVQHTFWKYLDSEKGAIDPARLKYKDTILHYYQRLDSIIGGIISRLNNDTTIIIVSDHGAEPLEKWLHPNVFLMKDGFLKIRRGIIQQTRYFLFRLGLTPLNALKIVLKLNALHQRERIGAKKTRKLMRAIFPSLRDVDWARTRAYSVGGWGRIFVNLKNREPKGIVQAGEEYDALCKSIIHRLGNLVDPATGEKLCINGKIFRKEEIYQGPYVDEAPDIVFQLRRGYLTFPGYEFGSNSIVSELRGWSAGHAMNGILMMKGNNVEKNASVTKAKIIDIAPTVLAVMGLPVPRDMDGRVLAEAFTKEYLAGTEIRYEDYNTQVDSDHVYSQEEVDELKRNLRSLGYL